METGALNISWQKCLLIFTAVLLLAVPQAALLPLIDRDEPRFAEAAREMIQSGNFIVPTFNGAPRYDKPPLIYWCEAAAYEVFGENAFAARLPSLLATAATAVLIFTWGVRLGSEALGMAAALSYPFCLQTVQQGRVATADALLIFFMTLTAFTGWLILKPKSGKCAPGGCYVVLALGFAGGFLAKGPEAWLPLFPLLWCARGSSSASVPRILLAFVAGLALVLLWGVPAYVETHGDFLTHSFKAGIADRAFGADQGHGTSNLGVYLLELPYYFLLFWISALPWSAPILFRARTLSTDWEIDLADRYLILNAALLFAVFTLLATKLPHYTLPAFPLLALLFIRRWEALGISLAIFQRVGWICGALFALLALIAVPVGLSYNFTPSPVGELVAAAGPTLKQDTAFAVVDFKEPTAIWEMRRITKAYGELIPVGSVATFLRQPGPHAVIITGDLNRSVSEMADPDWVTFSARGFNTAKGTAVELQLIVKP